MGQATEEVDLLSMRLQSESTVDDPLYKDRYHQLLKKAREKALFYDDLIESTHLFHGMVVNRSHDGHHRSECDSLLFSSLRYSALYQLGLRDRADRAWNSIKQASENGQWYRHPKCRRRWTSRDMIVGLLVALSHKPDQSRLYLQDLVSFIGSNEGYIGTGPFYVSLLSPGLGEIIRHLSLESGIQGSSLPPQVKHSFSTIEFDVLTAERGYTSHLNGLVLWLELQLYNRQNSSSPRIRSVTEALEGLPGHDGLKEMRFRWIAKRLVQVDGENLFFQWLQLKSNHAITEKSSYYMLRKLLSMPQFPDDRLPANCDRKADYLWQRDSIEYQANDESCHEVFSGVDFLWMVALLSELD